MYGLLPLHITYITLMIIFHDILCSTVHDLCSNIALLLYAPIENRSMLRLSTLVLTYITLLIEIENIH